MILQEEEEEEAFSARVSEGCAADSIVRSAIPKAEFAWRPYTRPRINYLTVSTDTRSKEAGQADSGYIQ